MSVQNMVTIADKIARGHSVKFQAMPFSDWDLFMPITECNNSLLRIAAYNWAAFLFAFCSSADLEQ